MAVMDDLDELLQGLPGFDLLTVTMKQAALLGARIPDVDGIWPGHPGYVVTHDVYYAAYSLLGFLQAQPVVTSAGSEGSTVSVAAPDWSALRTYYSGLSPILDGADVLRRVAIPEGPHVRRTNMRGEGSYYGDIDTDLG